MKQCLSWCFISVSSVDKYSSLSSQKLTMKINNVFWTTHAQLHNIASTSSSACPNSFLSSSTLSRNFLTSASWLSTLRLAWASSAVFSWNCFFSLEWTWRRSASSYGKSRQAKKRGLETLVSTTLMQRKKFSTFLNSLEIALPFYQPLKILSDWQVSALLKVCYKISTCKINRKRCTNKIVDHNNKLTNSEFLKHEKKDNPLPLTPPTPPGMRW